MAKLKVIEDINLRDNGQVIIINKDEYIEVSEEMAVYWCKEDIALLPLDKQKENTRPQHAIRTPADEQVNHHTDYTHIG